MNLLFIDACPRGKGVSRTLALAEAFFRAYEAAGGAGDITVHCLGDMALRPLDGGALQAREAKIDAGAFGDPLFDAARAFARAEGIVVAAPYWDLMFPAALKVYVEHVFVRELTFCYRNDLPIGLCRAERALYLTTAGGLIGDQDFGAKYLRAAFAMLGVPRLASVAAQGLDREGADTGALLGGAAARAAAWGRRWAEAGRK